MMIISFEYDRLRLIFRLNYYRTYVWKMKTQLIPPTIKLDEIHT